MYIVRSVGKTVVAKSGWSNGPQKWLKVCTGGRKVVDNARVQKGGGRRRRGYNG